jgi:hypothetical protein
MTSQLFRLETLWQPYIAGVLHGDGWCTPLGVGLRAKDLDFVETFCAALNVGFRLTAKPRRDERGYWLFRTSSDASRFQPLRDYMPKHDQERAAWLRGLFDSEGNAQLFRHPNQSPNAVHRRVAIYSTNLGTLDFASLLMDSLSIPNATRPTKNSMSHKGNKTVFELRVLRQEGFQRFASMVGSSIARKNQTLQGIAASYRLRAAFCSLGGQRGSATRLARRQAGGRY